MKKSPTLLTAALAVALAASAMGLGGRAAAQEECGEHGTTVIFAESAAEAAKQALQEEKLVFVLHVSGLFEDPGLT